MEARRRGIESERKSGNFKYCITISIFHHHQLSTLHLHRHHLHHQCLLSPPPLSTMLSSSRVDKGKGIAENQDGNARAPSRSTRGRSRRQQVAEEIDRAYAEQLQKQQEDEEFYEEVHRQETILNRQSQQQSNAAGDEEEVQAPSGRTLVSDIFLKHFKKLPRIEDSTSSSNDPAADNRPKYNAYCNYCNNVYKWMPGGGYGTLRRHIETCHPTEYGIPQSQTQIRGSTTSVTDSAPQIDVLKWWSKRTKYPILSIMAKELFAIPASTVSVEQAFSLGRLMLDQRSSRLKPRNVEATMLLDDRSRADLRAQENDWNDVDKSENEEFTETDRSEAEEN